MISRNIGLSSALVIGSLIGGATSAIALPVSAIATLPALAAVSETSAAAVTWESWSVPELFEIDVPTGWVTTALTNPDQAIVASYDAMTQTPGSTDVMTAITIVSEPPEMYVSATLDGLIEAALAGEYEIDRYGITSVGGNDAFRIWLVQYPGDFSQQAITFVGDGQGRTAQITSSYNDDSATTRDLIVQMHGSFRFDSSEE